MQLCIRSYNIKLTQYNGNNDAKADGEYDNEDEPELFGDENESDNTED